MGKSTIIELFSIAMLNNQRVVIAFFFGWLNPHDSPLFAYYTLSLVNNQHDLVINYSNRLL